MGRSLRIGGSSSTTRMYCWVIGSILRLEALVDLFGSNRPWDENAKTSATAAAVTDAHAAAVRENNGLTDRQSKTITWYVRLLHRPLAEEGFENASAVLGGDARALVVDRELQFAVGGNPS